MAMTAVTDAAGDVAWHSLSSEEATAQLHVTATEGLDPAEATRRLAEYGPNALPTEPPPSLWAVARGQLANPMQRPPRTPGATIVNGPQLIRWAISGFLVAGIALGVLAWGPGNPSTDKASISMTMAFAIVSLSAVNLGVVMRREREAPWSSPSPIFSYYGWIIAGWVLTWAAVELSMLQRLLDTVSLTGAQWLVVLGLSLVAPAFVGIERAIQLHRQAHPTALPHATIPAARG
jgi:magnesium-transporting ATPase (P-type)